MATSDLIPHLDCEITGDNLHQSVNEVVRILRPSWNENEVEIVEQSTGYVNTNYAILTPSGRDGLFLSIIGTKKGPGLVNKAINAMKYLMKQKLGAQLLLTFKNGLVMEYIYGEAVTWDTIDRVRNPEIMRSIAQETARYHAATNWDDIKEFNIRDYKFRNELYQVFFDKTEGIVPKEKLEGLPGRSEVNEWMDMIYKQMIDSGAEICFCHYDTNATNIIIVGDKAVFVDYDDCCVDFPCFEIARFFFLFSGVIEVDFDRIPSDKEQDAFVREYLEQRRILNPERGPVTEKLVEFLKFTIRKATLLLFILLTQAARFAPMVEKPVDPTMGHKCWQKFLALKDEILNETFTW